MQQKPKSKSKKEKHMKIDQLGEFGLIDKISKMFGTLVPNGCRSIGDDCAVLPLSDKESLVVTTDMLIEGVHFLKDRITPWELGCKSLAVNLSDVASMGARPYCTFLSIGLPGDCTSEWCDSFFEGYRSLGVPLLGGDTTSSLQGVVINITALGIVPNANIKLRSGAISGDRILVTSTLGDSGAGLRALIENKPQYTALIHAHHNPPSVTEQGIWLGKQPWVGAMMDISDGIASDLSHILKASSKETNTQLGATIQTNNIPISSTLKSALEIEPEWDSIKLTLASGEDYCLLLTARADEAIELQTEYTKQFPGQRLYDIGQIDNSGKINLLNDQEPLSDFHLMGFRHF